MPIVTGEDARITQIDAERSGTWSRIVEELPEPHLAHSAEWAAVIRRAYGHAPLYLAAEDAAGRAGVLPAFVVRRPVGGTVVTSMPFLDGGGPCSSSFGLGDALASLHGVVGVMMALHHRNANGGRGSGRGQVIDVALYEAVFNMMEGALPEYDLFGEARERTGSNLTGIVPSNTYLTRDAQHVVIGANADSIFKRLMKVIGREDLAADPSLADNAGRAERGEELDAVIGEWTATHDADEVVGTLNAAQVPSGKIYSMADIARDAHYLARDMIRQVRLKDGTPLKVPGIVPKLSATPGDIEWSGPELGEHTAAVLAAQGYSASEIAGLKERRVI